MADINIQDEIFPLVDTRGNVTGRATRDECHNGAKLLHPVIHLHIFNLKGELYIQKRSLSKRIFPGLWDSSVAGHISYGETPLEALIREAKEELGLWDIHPHFIQKYIIETEFEREFSYCYYAMTKQIPHPDMDEVSDGCFMLIEDIHPNIGKGIFTPNFESDFNAFLYRGFTSLFSDVTL